MDERLKQLSLKVWQQMEQAGFTAERTTFHQKLADVLEQMMNLRGQNRNTLLKLYYDGMSDEHLFEEYMKSVNANSSYTAETRIERTTWLIDRIRQETKQDCEYYLCGSYAECSTYNLQCSDGTVSMLSDVDITWCNRLRNKVCFGGCLECENHDKAIDTAEGHCQLVGLSPKSISPARTYDPQSCQPTQDLAQGRECIGWHKHCKFLNPQQHKLCSKFIECCQNKLMHIVAAARPGHRGEEGRISHSMLEREIFWCMHQLLHKVFSVFKYLIKKTPLNECGVRTYLGKTLTFYLCDRYMTDETQLHQDQLLHLVREGLQMLLEFLQDNNQPENSVMYHYFHDSALIYLKTEHSNRSVLIEKVNYVLTNLEDLVNQFTDQLIPIEHSFHFAQPFAYIPFSFAHLSDPTDRFLEILHNLTSNQCVFNDRHAFSLLSDKVEFYLWHLHMSFKNSIVDKQKSMGMITQLFRNSNNSEHEVANVLRVITLLNTDNQEDVRSLLISIHCECLQVKTDTNDIQGYIWDELTTKNIVWWFPVHEDCLRFFPHPFRCLKYEHPLELVVINFLAVANVLRYQHSVAEWTSDKWFGELKQRIFHDWQELYAFSTVTIDSDQLVWAASKLAHLAIVEPDIQLTAELINAICQKLINEDKWDLMTSFSPTICQFQEKLLKLLKTKNLEIDKRDQQIDLMSQQISQLIQHIGKEGNQNNSQNNN